jgi:hypothetical protein
MSENERRMTRGANGVLEMATVVVRTLYSS